MAGHVAGERQQTGIITLDDRSAPPSSFPSAIQVVGGVLKSSEEKCVPAA